MLQFLLKYPNNFARKQAQHLREVAATSGTPAHKWECFKMQKNLSQAREAIRSDYQELFTHYKNRPHQELTGLLQANHQQIAFFTRTDLQYDATLTLQGRIRHPATPKPTEISLHDYQTLARRYFKQLCGNSRNYVVENIDHLPPDDPLTERQVTTLLGHKANHLHSAATQMATMMNVGNDTRQKVTCVKELFQTEHGTGGEFQDVLPVYLAFYSMPIHFRNYLAHAWQVDAPWVRNTLVGWRRKVDPWLCYRAQAGGGGTAGKRGEIPLSF